MASQLLWTNDRIMEFIELYKTERILWDPKHPHHKNRNDVSSAWNRIKNCLDVDFSVKDLKKKKESLMTAFRLHLNRKRKSSNYQTTWFAYTAFESFLGTCTRYVSENPDQLKSDDSTSQLENQFYKTDETSNHEMDPVDPILFHTRETEAEVYKPNQVLLVEPSNSREPLTFTLKSETNYDTDENDKHTRDNDDMDECVLYGKLLAKKLKKMNEHQRDLAMHEIDMIMFRIKTKK